MTATMKPIDWTDETLEQATRGEFRVRRFDQPVAMRLNKAQRDEYEASKARGYIFRSRAGQAATENCYWQWCEIHKLPVVSIRRKCKYATISVDMIVAPCDLDAEAMNEINALRVADRRDLYDGFCNVNYALIERILLADAERVAFAAHKAAMACISRAPQERIA